MISNDGLLTSMRHSRTILALSAVFAVTFGAAGPVAAQKSQSQAPRAVNMRATDNLRLRIAATERRIAEGERGRAITPAGAAALRRQLTTMQTQMTRFERRQGFVSAAELASFNRTLGGIDVELDRRGTARSYGTDMLVASNTNKRDSSFRYDCQNVPARLEIPGHDLTRALNQLRLATHCPISGTDLARGMRSRPVVGTMTPTEALQAMLRGTGLQMRGIKGGFEVVRLPR